MAGHSKWKNILHKKEKTDAQRAKTFTKIGREIAVAVREGGPDPASNTKLKDCIAKAKANNVPNDNIKRIIDRASGADSTNYEQITYEGYGPGGIAVIVETLTDNRNRTASSIRHHFDKYGGNLGTSGCVSWQFSSKGLIYIEKKDLNEDEVMLDCIDSGAEDFILDEEVFEVTSATDDLHSVKEALEEKGYNILSAEQALVPQTLVSLSGDEDIKNMEKLLSLLEDDDDVQNVWHNWAD
jgi:YebC/PmpR family DNA-binding regulatory protein